MTFKAFARKVEAAGLKARDCGNGHWRIEAGKFSVNWYPNSKRRSIYINGFGAVVTTSGDADRAIALALTPPIVDILPKPLQEMRKKDYVGFKRRALSKNPRCYLCGCKVDWHSASADHVIPLSKGGSNGEDNLRLACKPCNRMKGDKLLIELEERP